MNIAVFSKSICPISEKLIESLNANGVTIQAVIIEKKFRKKLTPNELKFKQVHQTFHQRHKRNSFIKKTSKAIRESLRLSLQAKLFKESHRIPVIKNQTIHYFCRKRNIPAHFTDRHSSEFTRQLLDRKKIDYVVLGSSNWLIKENILNDVSFKIINAHPGYLPKHRGLDSNLWAIQDGDPVGVTTYIVDKGLDTGPILKFFELDLNTISNLNEYFSEISKLKNQAVIDTIQGLKDQTIKPHPQKEKYKAHEPMSLEQIKKTEALIEAKNQPSSYDNSPS